ncbi:hypothetical protein Ae150APs1_6176c [Pseudonocardia sp. Ae150A_Ps1]|nr:hypothetical protein Ae150APs1_6176c [Pseudonocardia sp. Ae150A_Ps1]
MATGLTFLALLAAAGFLLMSEGARIPIEGNLVGLMTAPSRKIPDGFSPLSSGGCAGFGEFGEIRAGARISVLNSKRELIGSGHLKDSVIVGSSCQFSFRIDGVPKSGSYRVSVASRKPLSWSAAEVEAPGGIRMFLGA